MQLIASDGDRRVSHYAGPIRALSLDALVLPMTPDLSLMISSPLANQVLVESGGENLIELPDKYEKELSARYPRMTRGGLPFWVPPCSAHIIPGHKKTLAKHLIYAVPIDARDGDAYFDLEILAQTVENALDLAEQTGCKSVGITPLVSSMVDDSKSPEEWLRETISTTALTATRRLRRTSLHDIYVLSPDEAVEYVASIQYGIQN